MGFIRWGFEKILGGGKKHWGDAKTVYEVVRAM